MELQTTGKLADPPRGEVPPGVRLNLWPWHLFTSPSLTLVQRQAALPLYVVLDLYSSF